MLFLGLRELVEHGLHAAFVQALPVVDFRIVAEHLEHAIAGLTGAGGAGACDASGHHFERRQSFGHGFGLLTSFVGELTSHVAAVAAERLGFGVGHRQQHILVFLGLFSDLLQARSHNRTLRSGSSAAFQMSNVHCLRFSAGTWHETL